MSGSRMTASALLTAGMMLRGGRAARRAARSAHAKLQRDMVSELVAATSKKAPVWRVNLLEQGGVNAGASIEMRSPKFGSKKMFRGQLQSQSFDAAELAALDPPKPNRALARLPPQVEVPLLPATPSSSSTSRPSGRKSRPLPGTDDVVDTSQPQGRLPVPMAELIRRLRRMPLPRLAEALVELPEVIAYCNQRRQRRIWKALYPRLVKNMESLPPTSVLAVLASWKDLKMLHKRNQLLIAGTRALKHLATLPPEAFHAEGSPLVSAGVDDEVLALLEACKVAASVWRSPAHGDRIFRTLSCSFGTRLPGATLKILMPWADFYASLGLVDGPHMQFWDRFGEVATAAALPGGEHLAGPDEWKALLDLEAKLPVWIANDLEKPLLEAPQRVHVLLGQSQHFLGPSPEDPMPEISAPELVGPEPATTAIEIARNIEVPQHGRRQRRQLTRGTAAETEDSSSSTLVPAPTPASQLHLSLDAKPASQPATTALPGPPGRRRKERMPDHLLPPMYQTNPPVPVLWHVSAENYMRHFTRMGTKQLALAVTYVSEDLAGLRSNMSDLPETSRPGAGWPHAHRDIRKAQSFVAALTQELASKAEGLRPSEACFSIEALGKLRKANLLSLEAAELVTAAVLSSKGLSGAKSAPSLTPEDVQRLLAGLGSLAESCSEAEAALEAAGEANDRPRQQPRQQLILRRLLDAGSVERLVLLASCAVQEAPPPAASLRSMMESTTVLLRFANETSAKRQHEMLLTAGGEGQDALAEEQAVALSGLLSADRELKRTFGRFLQVSAERCAARPRPKRALAKGQGGGKVASRRFREILMILESAAGSGLWASPAFPLLVPAVVKTLRACTEEVTKPLLAPPDLNGSTSATSKKRRGSKKAADDASREKTRTEILNSVAHLDEILKLTHLFASARRPPPTPALALALLGCDATLAGGSPGIYIDALLASEEARRASGVSAVHEQEFLRAQRTKASSFCLDILHLLWSSLSVEASAPLPPKMLPLEDERWPKERRTVFDAKPAEEASATRQFTSIFRKLTLFVTRSCGDQKGARLRSLRRRASSSSSSSRDLAVSASPNPVLDLCTAICSARLVGQMQRQADTEVFAAPAPLHPWGTGHARTLLLLCLQSQAEGAKQQDEASVWKHQCRAWLRAMRSAPWTPIAIEAQPSSLQRLLPEEEEEEEDVDLFAASPSLSLPLPQENTARTTPAAAAAVTARPAS